MDIFCFLKGEAGDEKMGEGVDGAKVVDILNADWDSCIFVWVFSLPWSCLIAVGGGGGDESMPQGRCADKRVGQGLLLVDGSHD